MAASRLRPRRAPVAFSLIEIVIALGVISFALIGIIGMLPVAMDAATTSQRETQAAFIAHGLYSEMSSMPGTNTFVTISTNYYDHLGSQDGRISINLTDAKDYYLAFDSDGMPLKATDASTFSSGNNDSAYLARITVSTNSNSPTAPLPTGVSRVDIRVDAPGVAKEEKRKPYYFTTLLSQKENP